MESLIQLKRRLSQWSSEGAINSINEEDDEDIVKYAGDNECNQNGCGNRNKEHTSCQDRIGHHNIRKIKIVRTEGTINYDLVDATGKVCNTIAKQNNTVPNSVQQSITSPKPFTSPFIVRVEPLPKQRNAMRRQIGAQQCSFPIVNTNNNKHCNLMKYEPSHFTDLPAQYNISGEDTRQTGGNVEYEKLYRNNVTTLRKFPFRQRRSVNASITDEEVRAAYAKLRLTLPNSTYDEMTESERGVYRFVRRRLMNKNSARQSRLRRKELFKEYENTINLQAEKLKKTEDRLRMLLRCFLNAITLISLQSIPQMMDPNNILNQHNTHPTPVVPIVTGCNQCDKVQLFNIAILDAISIFDKEYYNDSEGIQQLLVELRLCSQEQPMHQLFQRQERILHALFSKGIKSILCSENIEGGDVIPMWKFNLITSSALRSAWSIFLGPNEQSLLFDSHAQGIKEESSTYFESVVNDLFDPEKHEELLKSLRNSQTENLIIENDQNQNFSQYHNQNGS